MQYTREAAPTMQRKSIIAPPPGTTPAGPVSLALRSILLFAIGMLYGLLVRHLHDDRQLAPFQVEGIIKPSKDWRYLVFWGVAGVGLGSLLPWVDMVWEESMGGKSDGEDAGDGSLTPQKDAGDGDVTAAWTPVVRSVGAFVGIAFAIVSLSPCSMSLC